MNAFIKWVETEGSKGLQFVEKLAARIEAIEAYIEACQANGTPPVPPAPPEPPVQP